MGAYETQLDHDKRKLTEALREAETRLAGVRLLAAYYAEHGAVWDGNTEEVGREFLEAVEGHLPEWLSAEPAEGHTAGSRQAVVALRYIAVPTCAECGTQWHPGATCKVATETRAQFGRLIDMEATKILAEARNLPEAEPKRGSLFAASSEDAADARLWRYTEQANVSLRPETLAALSEALQAEATPRRLMIRKHEGWWVKGCAACRQPVEYCDCPVDEP